MPRRNALTFNPGYNWTRRNRRRARCFDSAGSYCAAMEAGKSLLENAPAADLALTKDIALEDAARELRTRYCFACSERATLYSYDTHECYCDAHAPDDCERLEDQ